MAGGDAAALGQAEGLLQNLNGLQRRLEHAGPGALAAIRAEVTAAVTSSQASAQLARTSAAMAQAAEVALHAASAAAHQRVEDFTRDFYEHKIFDPYLRFDSGKDEAEYRHREAERLRQIEAAKAENTPDGNLRALRLAKEQLLDAGAHGADKSADYRPLLDGLNADADRLAATMRVARGPATNEVDAALADAPAPTRRDTDPLAAASRLLASGVVVADAGAGHGVADRTAPQTIQQGRS